MLLDPTDRAIAPAIAPAIAIAIAIVIAISTEVASDHVSGGESVGDRFRFGNEHSGAERRAEIVGEAGRRLEHRKIGCRGSRGGAQHRGLGTSAAHKEKQCARADKHS
ncbi:hypothetical protein ACFT1A_04750 [Rhodococcus sp. NPDC057135]|uniref:hypothetical protein n=1 Tax=Rhodococcus sp. NPDC057135 TaxID=3346028 RepID=UPI003644C7FE